MSAPARFSFLDEGEALRRLGVDRDTLLTLVREKRLRAYPGVGKGNFYRLRDIDALRAELYDEAASPAATETGEGEAPPTGRKVFDPAYKVHVRLQADLKWYDLEDEDLQAWVRELHEDGYARQRSNITSVMAKLQRLIDLMDEAAAGWQTLKPNLPAQAATSPAPDATPATGESATGEGKPRRKTLPMFSGAQTPTPLQAPPSPPMAPAAPTTKMRGRDLPMASLPQRPPIPQTEQANQSDEGNQSDSAEQRD
ncbi:MAG: helix-turn-helix domain-containing protein [Ktedonobacterales bacterium]